jgi:hypothetical protein
MIKLASFLLISVLIFPLSAFAGGDEIELKDGSILRGDVIARNAIQIYLSTKEKGVMKVDVSDIRVIRFGPTLLKKTEENTANSPIQEKTAPG